MTLALIRHGCTEANRMRRYLGRGDEPLSGEGREGLLRARDAGCFPRIDILFSSPMKRCTETAALLYPGMRPILIDEWREIDFGCFEGKSFRELGGDLRYRRWIRSGGSLPFPEGESREEFAARCEKGLFKMREILADGEEQRVGAIVHGGTIMALLSRYLGGGYFDYRAPNGGGYECRMKLWRDPPEMTEVARYPGGLGA